ncbi:MAG: DNA polymerase domain-containing protein [Candidatus Nitrosocosmicus sp.]
MKLIANGWLFDIYHLKDRMVLWIKEKNDDGGVKRLEYPWSPSIYVAADLKSELNSLIRNSQISCFAKEFEFKEKYEYPSEQGKKETLKLTVNDSSQIDTLAKNIENLCSRFGHYRLYNVDVSPEQSFLYEKDIYPLGLYNIEERPTGPNGLNLCHLVNDKSDSIESFDYLIPNFRFLSFDIISEKKTVANDLNDKISKINVVSFDKDNKDVIEKFSITEDTELETILEFAYEANRIDPDIILTTGGDQFLFPHLFQRAKANGIENQLLINLNRESNMEYLIKKNFLLMGRNAISTSKAHASGLSSTTSSYVSYGKVHFKPRPFFLYGRTHIDTNNSFIYKDNGLDGLAELSRVCRMPLQLASRSTIGRCLSSLYFYNAQKRDVLIPWKPVTSEIFKSFSDLLKADRGGFVFDSKPGAYDKVAELDFVSLYPNIMLKRNVSSDTINCECCESEPDNKVPGLEHLYHLCKERMGIVPLSLKTVLTRRLEYKNRKKNSLTCAAGKNEQMKNLYDNRQTALKWILVTSFGYLGFSNSKFGRIDAHIAVCAFARHILLKTSKIAEKHGFEVIHGIVDSIWVREKNGVINYSRCDPNSSNRYMRLKKDIEAQTGFSISFEGIYKWIVFDSSKTNPKLPALNRYFGVFEDGTIKARGIETRRHDTPQLFIDFQYELLQALSRFNSVGEIKQSTHVLEDICNKYQSLILSGKASHSDLAFTKRISKDTDEYSSRDTLENCVLKILSNKGKSLHAGEEIKYIITDFYNKNHLERASPIELLDKHHIKYDEKRYSQLLSDAYNSIIKFFYIGH